MRSQKGRPLHGLSHDHIVFPDKYRPAPLSSTSQLPWREQRVQGVA